MKTRWTLMIVFFLSVAVGGSPASAGVYGYGHYRHPHHGYPYPHYRHHHYYHHYGHGGDVFLGALFGFTLGALLTPPPPVYVYREYPPTVVHREYVYVPAPTRIYREPVSSSYARTGVDPSCLQTREYTTTITIEGKEVEAYGTKCLRPDGSWSYGPAQPVPSD